LNAKRCGFGAFALQTHVGGDFGDSDTAAVIAVTAAGSAQAQACCLIGIGDAPQTLWKEFGIQAKK
jgi:hypothetical protein